MIAVDSQILVYAHRQDAPQHEAAVDRLIELAESGQRWAIPWPCVHEFLNIVTHPRIYDPPSGLEVAFAAVRAWTRSPGLRFIGEGPEHLDSLFELAVAGKISGPKIHDARIASICMDHGVKMLWSADRDFSRFPRLGTENPLIITS